MNKETHEVPVADIARVIAVLSDSIDNTQELLEDHLTRLGETTGKNRAVANEYRCQLVEATRVYNQLIEYR